MIIGASAKPNMIKSAISHQQKRGGGKAAGTLKR